MAYGLKVCSCHPLTCKKLLSFPILSAVLLFGPLIKGITWIGQKKVQQKLPALCSLNNRLEKNGAKITRTLFFKQFPIADVRPPYSNRLIDFDKG